MFCNLTQDQGIYFTSLSTNLDSLQYIKVIEQILSLGATIIHSSKFHLSGIHLKIDMENRLADVENDCISEHMLSHMLWQKQI